jgi:hypothetical protein
MLARKVYLYPQPPESGLSDSIALQLAEPVGVFVSGRVQPIADELSALFREQVRLVLRAERPTASASALALVGRTKLAMAEARRALLVQATGALGRERVLAQAFGLEREFLQFVRDSVDAVLSRCRASAADEMRPVLEQVFLDAPMRKVARAVARERAKAPLRSGAARLGNSPIVSSAQAQPSFAVLSLAAVGTMAAPFSPFVVLVTASGSTVSQATSP